MAGQIKNHCVRKVLSAINYNEIHRDNSGINACIQNIRSINRNLDDFLLFLNTLVVNIDIIALVETWWCLGSAPVIEGYNLYEYSSGLNKSSGVAIYITEKIKSNVCNWLLNVGVINSVDYCFIDLKITGTTCYTVGVIYRSPRTKISDFLVFWAKLLWEIQSLKKNVIILGDININVLNTHDDNSNGFRVLVKVPTRVCNKSGSLLDLVITNILVDTNTYVIESLVTDHYTVLSNFHMELNYKLNYSGATEETCINYVGLANCLYEAEFEDALNLSNVNDSFLFIIKRFNWIIENNSFTLLKNNRNILPIHPWMTRSMVRALRKKNKLKYKVNKNPHNLCLKNKYIKYRNIFNLLLKTAKKDYYVNQFGMCTGNNKQTWSVINNVLGIKKNKSTDPKVLFDEDSKVFLKQPGKISNFVNSWFCRFSSQGNTPLAGTGSDGFERCEKSAFFQPTCISEIWNIIKNMKDSHSSGLDNISNWMIKRTTKIFHILVHLFNISMAEGVFPDSLKPGKIILKYKGGTESDVNNYRPITILSPISKILEKVIVNRIVSFLNVNKLLNKNQYAFQQGKGCDDVLFVATEFIKKALDSGNYVFGAAIDLSKAFDNVSHKLLLGKLNNLGFRGICLDFLSSYLSKRMLKSLVGGSLSDAGYLKRGVPQGSVLGPILFNIFINDMNLDVPGVNILNYADDNFTLLEGKVPYDMSIIMQKVLDELNAWYNKNELSINTKKSVIILFGSKRKLKTINMSNFTFHIGLHEIEIKDDIKYLGLIIDKHLSWVKHIRKLQNETAVFVPIFYRIRNIFDKNVLMKIFYACYRSKIMYGLKYYGATYKTYLETINSTFRKILRIINFLKNRDSLKDVFIQDNILNIYQLHVYELLKTFLIARSERSETFSCLKFNFYEDIECRYLLRKSSKMLTIVPVYVNDYGRFSSIVRINLLINFLFVNGTNLLEMNPFTFGENKEAVLRVIGVMDVVNIKNVY